jgi:uncharacterized protein YggU (UPF0235/DUF167 family)
MTVIPNAKSTTAQGTHDGVLKLRLAAAPIDGRANEALCNWVAEQLDLPKRAVRVRRGASSRLKQVEIAAPPAAVSAWLANLEAQPPRP